MIIANFKYKGEITRVELPGSWDEMKVRHYLALETTKNPLELMALLSDVDLTKILNTKTDIKPVINKLLTLLATKPPEFSRGQRHKFLIDGKTVNIPTNFNRITFGQSAMIETYLAESNGDERKAIAQIMGVILQPLLDKGDFDLDRAKHYEKLTLELPIIDVFPNVFFFWKVLKEYTIILKVSSTLYQ